MSSASAGCRHSCLADDGPTMLGSCEAEGEDGLSPRRSGASAAQAGHVMGTTNYCEAVDGFLPVGLHLNNSASPFIAVEGFQMLHIHDLIFSLAIEISR